MTAPRKHLPGLLTRPGWRKLTADDLDPDDPFDRLVLEGGATILDFSRERAVADRTRRGLGSTRPNTSAKQGG